MHISKFIIFEPGHYLLGIIVALILNDIGYDFTQAATVMFWWFVVCTGTIGLYNVFFCTVSVLHYRDVAKDTYNGWNLQNLPGLQDIKRTNPEQAEWLGQMRDTLDQTMWHSEQIRLYLTVSMYFSLVAGAFFLKSYAMSGGWWRIVLAIILLGYGLIMHSAKLKEVILEIKLNIWAWSKYGRRNR